MKTPVDRLPVFLSIGLAVLSQGCSEVQWGVKATMPQVVSVSAALGMGYDIDDGVFLQVEPGLGGIRLNVGLSWSPDNHPMTFFQEDAGFLKLSLMRTWGDPWGVEPDQTYMGVGLGTVIGGVTLGYGAYRRISPDGGEDDRLMSVDIGVGF